MPPRLHRDWACHCHISTKIRLAAATSARDWAYPAECTAASRFCGTRVVCCGEALALSVSCCFVQRTARRSTDSETRFPPSQVMRSTAGPRCRRRTLACRVASWAQPCIVARGILHLAHCVLICARLGLASLVCMLSRAACCLPRCCVSTRSLPAVNRVSHACCGVAHRALHPCVRRSEALVSRLARGACCCLLPCLVSHTTMNVTCPYRVAAALLVDIGEARNAFM